jgi:hypothetical protein
MWKSLMGWLAWLAADPAAVTLEEPRAAASVAYAYAAMATDDSAPEPKSECACGGTCVAGRYKPDGRIEADCPCPASCDCKR